MADITLITPTGDRPKAFVLCERWISRQTFQGSIEWIVVDDGQIPTICTKGQRYVRRQPHRDDPRHTLPLNILAAIEVGVHSDKVLIIEDDDWYAPHYLEHYAKLLSHFDVVGEGLARYYYLPKRYHWRLDNFAHASFGQTGIRSRELPVLKKAAASTKIAFLDERPWFDGSKNILMFVDGRDLHPCHCSIKGMPGRESIWVSQNADVVVWLPDEDYRILQRWVRDDTATYTELVAAVPDTPDRQEVDRPEYSIMPQTQGHQEPATPGSSPCDAQ